MEGDIVYDIFNDWIVSSSEMKDNRRNEKQLCVAARNGLGLVSC